MQLTSFLTFALLTLGYGVLTAEDTLRIYGVDVEGGAATLVITPAGESILIDTGNPGDRDAVRINQLAREEAGISKIDHLVIIMNNAHRKGTGPVTVAGLRSSPGLEAIYQVHQCTRDGDEHLNTQPEKIANLKSGEDCDGNHLFLTVASDGRSYTVTVPRSNHAGQYQTR